MQNKKPIRLCCV